MENNFELVLKIFDNLSYNKNVKTTIVENGVLKTITPNWLEILPTIKTVEADARGEITFTGSTLSFDELVDFKSSFLHICPEQEETIILYFPKLKTYMGHYLFLGNQSSVSFPELIEVSDEFYIQDADYTEEVHFRADKKEYFEALEYYSEKFGCINATIYFDL